MLSTILLTVLPLATAFTPCPLLGPVFPAPTQLATDLTFQSSIKNLTTTLKQAIATSQTQYGSLAGNSTSYSIGVFDAKTSSTLLSIQHTAALSTLDPSGVKNVTENTIYRIGSNSKLVTAYLFLLEAGSRYWSQPVTDFVPELLEETCSAAANSIDCTDWKDITLGALAGHMAGIARDYTGSSALSVDGVPFTELGLPLPPASAQSICNETASYPCSRAQYLKGLTQEHPAEAPFTTPVYSNAGYQVLSYALENITGRSYQSMLESDLFGPLGMNSSSYGLPLSGNSNGIIPVSASASEWNYAEGDSTPDGGLYSTQSDLIKMGRSILNYELLSRTTTREWMKLDTGTSNLRMLAGKPWEIYRQTVGGRIVDLYTKSGDLGSYSSLIVLSPDYDVGFVVLSAGTVGSAAVAAISDIIAGTLFPALEATARFQAQSNLAGTYNATNGLESSIILTTDPSGPGLKVTTLVSNGTNFLAEVLKLLLPFPALDVRLCPSDLVKSTANGTTTRTFQAIVQNADLVDTGGVFDQSCQTWFSVQMFTYGNVGDNEFLFELDGDGKAIAVVPRVFNITLQRT